MLLLSSLFSNSLEILAMSIESTESSRILTKLKYQGGGKTGGGGGGFEPESFRPLVSLAV